MEKFSPPPAGTDPLHAAERLPFDLVRALIASRQAATPTVKALSGAAAVTPGNAGQPQGLLHYARDHRAADEAGRLAGARFADCSVGRVGCTDRGVSG